MSAMRSLPGDLSVQAAGMEGLLAVCEDAGRRKQFGELGACELMVERLAMSVTEGDAGLAALAFKSIR
jgi:hypothetical protein